MVTHQLVRRLTLPMAALLTVYVATLALPDGDSCPSPAGVAGAAPSPTCGGDLRECLRLSAKTGIYGARYVTGEDVAKCVEAFNACIHGGASTGGGNPVPSTSGSPSGGTASLPRRFGIKYGTLTGDCQLSGTAVSCTTQREEQLPNGSGTYSETGEITATVSGMTMTGTVKRHGISSGDCVSTQDLSGPITYTLQADGTMAIREGPMQQNIVFSGDCTGSASESNTTPVWAGTGTWSAR